MLPLLPVLLFVRPVHSFIHFRPINSINNIKQVRPTTIVQMSTPPSEAPSVTTMDTINITTSACITHEERLQIYLKKLDMLELPPAPKAAANYSPCQRSGDLLYISGHLPFSTATRSSSDDGSGTTTTTLEPYTGRLGSPILDDDTQVDVVTAADPLVIGVAAARQVGLNIIATIREELGGSINDVDQIIKLFGLVQSHDDFHHQHLVMNGCSDLMTSIFGPIAGKHARSAVGTNALPLNSMIEIEAIVRLKLQPPS